VRPARDPFSDYSISIEDALGRQVPLTDEGKRVYTPAPMPTARRTIVVELAPNESTTSIISLSQYFDIARRGKYRVKVSDRVEGVKPHATASTIINVPGAAGVIVDSPKS